MQSIDFYKPIPNGLPDQLVPKSITFGCLKGPRKHLVVCFILKCFGVR
jgi:hypothetical protein